MRIVLQPIEANGQPRAIEYDGALVKQALSAPRAKSRSLAGVGTARCGDLVVRLSAEPLTVRIETRGGRLVQRLRVDDATAAMSFLIGEGPVFGLGVTGIPFWGTDTGGVRPGQGVDG